MGFLAAAALAGCSQTIAPPATVPVSGAVTLKGKAAPGVRVTLNPQFDMGKQKWAVTGETGADGAFKVGTGVPGNGAPPGDYIVTFEKPRTDTDRKQNYLEIEVDDFKGKYSDPAKSAWKVTIVKGENKLDTFALD
jgi:hypothetical protein